MYTLGVRSQYNEHIFWLLTGLSPLISTPKLFLSTTILHPQFLLVIPPTPAIEAGKEKFHFNSNTTAAKGAENARSVENLYAIKRTGSQKPTELLFVPKLADSRRLSIPVVLIPGETKADSKFNSSDNVYLENLYKAASVSSLGNFGNIAAEPMPVIKNKEGKW